MGAATARARDRLRCVSVQRGPQPGRDVRLMAHLLDTNVLVRLANAADARHAVAAKAVLELHRRGEMLHLTAQNLIEFRNTATRPMTVNGLGLSIADTE